MMSPLMRVVAGVMIVDEFALLLLVWLIRKLRYRRKA